MPIRILRLIEIEYPSFLDYAVDRRNWALKDGETSFGLKVYRQTTILPVEVPENKPKMVEPHTFAGVGGTVCRFVYYDGRMCGGLVDDGQHFVKEQIDG